MSAVTDTNNRYSHEGVKCDGCGASPIIGSRYQCEDCENFDFCAECKSNKPHDEHHRFIEVKKPERIGIITIEMLKRLLPRSSEEDIRKVAGLEEFRQGVAAQQKDDLPTALIHFDQALQMYVALKDDDGIMKCNYMIGCCLREGGKFRAAIESFKNSLGIAYSLLDRRNTALSLIGLCYSCIAISNEAFSQYAAALQKLDEFRIDYIEIMVAHFNNIGSSEKSLKLLQDAGALNIDLNKAQLFEVRYRILATREKQEVVVLSTEVRLKAFLANSFYAIGDYDNALIHFRSIYEKKEELQKAPDSLLLQVWCNYGACLIMNGEFTEGIQICSQLLQKPLTTILRGTLFVNIATAYYKIGRYGDAFRYFDHASRIAATTEDFQLNTVVVDRIANMYYVMGMYAKALSYFKACKMLCETGGFKVWLATTLANIGNCWHSLGDINESKSYGLQHLDLTRELKDLEGECGALYNLGNLEFAEENYETALEYHKQSLESAKKSGIKFDIMQAKSFIGLELIFLNKLEEAEGFIREVLDTCEFSSIQIQCAVHMSILQHAKFNSEEEENYLRRACDEIEKSRISWKSEDFGKAMFLSNQDSCFQRLQYLLFNQKRYSEALEVAEKARARAFAEKLMQNPTELNTRLENNLKNLPMYVVSYSSVDNTYTTNQVSSILIWVVTPSKEVLCREVEVDTWKKEHEQQLEIICNEIDLSHKEKSVNVMKVVIDTFLKTVSTNGRGLYSEVFDSEKHHSKLITTCLSVLYDLLIKPIENLLPSNPEELVTFIPHKDLFLVPFSALLSSPSLRKENYLISKHTISIAPSIAILSYCLEKKQDFPISEALIIGNPKMPCIPQAPLLPNEQDENNVEVLNLDPLPHAEGEAKNIATLLQTQALTKEAATKSAVLEKISSASVIHFATHGLLTNLLRSDYIGAIALAPESDPPQALDGFLFTEEIMHLQLAKADIVTLSACNTGQGVVSGDGIIGLARAFMIAGAPRVVVSLWTVDDQVTSEMMHLFYQNCYQKKMNKPGALRSTVMKMLNNRSICENPYLWAAFYVLGKP